MLLVLAKLWVKKRKAPKQAIESTCHIFLRKKNERISNALERRFGAADLFRSNDRLVQSGPAQVGPKQVRISQVRSGQVGPRKISIDEIGAGEIGPAQIGKDKIRLVEVRFCKVGFAQVRMIEIGSA